MENSPIIEIKNVGKRYNINHHRGGYVALRDVIMTVLKSPLRFLKSKAKEIAGIDTKEEFWALKDINLEVSKGEVVGIIGPNGSGKSTLLKILSQITPPTEGEIKIRGKVGSLLEVGTGFHPELSGRENIFLNGAILGMHKKEIAEKFDQIVEFAGLEKFIDTPVKYYSSGMYVRLAFSVAAHMEPDVLIVDEVPAVGDAEFQKKCLGKMDEITKSEGRTILFVSHNMTAIAQLCTRCILLKEGHILSIGKTENVIEQYAKNLSGKKETLTAYEFKEDLKKEFQVLSLRLKNSKGAISNKFACDDDVFVELNCISRKPLTGLYGDIIFSKDGDKILQSYTFDSAKNSFSLLPEGNYTTSIKIPARTLGHGTYTISISFTSDHRMQSRYVDTLESVASFQLDDLSTESGNHRAGHLSTLLKWEVLENKEES